MSKINKKILGNITITQYNMYLNNTKLVLTGLGRHFGFLF
jgi:hypothetical protein